MQADIWAELAALRALIAEQGAMIATQAAQIAALEQERRRARSVEAGGQIVLSGLLELGADAFHAGDVFEAGRLNPAFGKVLLDADLVTEGSVGYFLRRARGLLVGNFRLERIGRDARGTVWGFVAE